MAIDTTQTPKDIPLFRTRGDTKQWTFVIQNSAGVVIDITGFSFLLTVDPSEEPTDALGNLFQLVGVIPTGADGRVTFTLSTAQADQTPSEYFYDVQMTDLAAALSTIIKSTYTVSQDITK